MALLLLLLLVVPLLSAESNLTTADLYSVHRAPEEYHSTQLSFDPRGLEHLYLLTTTFLDWIQPVGLPPALVTKDVFDHSPQVLLDNRVQIIRHFLGLLVLSLLTVLVAVVLPLGLVGYCCCCRTPSAKRPQPSRRQAFYRRVVYGTLLLVLVLVMMFCVICGFITNEYMEHGLQTLPTTIRHSSYDVSLFLNNTKLEINMLFKTNFKQLEDKLHSKLDRTGEVVHDRLLEIAGVASVDNLTKIVSSLESLQGRLTTAASLTAEMQTQCEELHTALRMARRDLSSLLEGCPPAHCSTKYNTSLLAVVSDLSMLPNLTSIILDISFLLKQNIETEVKKGKAAFDKLSHTLQKSVNKSIPEIKEKLKRVGSELGAFADNITSFLHFDDYNDTERYVVSFLNDSIHKYGYIRWYVCMGICCGLAAIVVSFSLGLVYGSCGHTAGHGDHGCSKATGGRFLAVGIVCVFLLSSALLLATAAMFLAGAATERGGCDLAANPHNPQLHKVAEVLQRVFPLFYKRETDEVQINLADMIGQCHQNATLYRALGFMSLEQISVGGWTLGNLSQITSYRQHYDFGSSLEHFSEQLSSPQQAVSVELVSPQGEALLARLRDTPLGRVNVTLYRLMSRRHVTLVSLPHMALQLRATAALLPASQREVSNELREIASRLDIYDQNLASPIMKKLDQLRMVAEQLHRDTQFGGQSFHVAIGDLLKQAIKAQDLIKTRGKEEIRKMADDLIEEITKLMDDYGLRVKTQLETNTGKCRPVSQAFNATHSKACNEVVLPFNGFWASVGVCTLLSVPGMMLAWKLATLYCSNPYRGGAGGGGGGHQDLGHPKHRRSHKPTGADSYEAGGGGAGGYLTAMGLMYPGSRAYSPPDRSTPSAPSAETTHIWEPSSSGADFNKPPPYFYPPR